MSDNASGTAVCRFHPGGSLVKLLDVLREELHDAD
jgi:hypothetical protein